MIKVSKFLYIHPLFVILAVFSYINRFLGDFFINFSIITLHELAHLISAKFLGLTPKHIIIYPFGANLRLKNTMLFSISDEVILYLSGPLLNAFLAILSLIFISYNDMFSEIYYKNLSLFIINILPIAPLDGGMVLKKLMIYKFGFLKGNKLSKIISIVCLLPLAIGFFVLIKENKYNSYLFIFILFLVGNIVISKEKYNSDFLKELLYCRQKKKNKKIYVPKIISTNNRISKKDIAKCFNMCDKYLVFITKEDGTLEKISTEEEIISSILNT